MSNPLYDAISPIVVTPQLLHSSIACLIDSLINLFLLNPVFKSIIWLNQSVNSDEYFNFFLTQFNSKCICEFTNPGIKIEFFKFIFLYFNILRFLYWSIL